MKIHDYLKNNYGYSDFQIGQIRYTIISILSDVSKLIIMGIFFILTDYFFQYLAAIATLLVLRTCTGGLHFKHYFSCLALSFFSFIYRHMPTPKNIASPSPLLCPAFTMYTHQLFVCTNCLFVPSYSKRYSDTKSQTSGFSHHYHLRAYHVHRSAKPVYHHWFLDNYAAIFSTACSKNCEKGGAS